jgi:hypothetical protein
MVPMNAAAAARRGWGEAAGFMGGSFVVVLAGVGGSVRSLGALWAFIAGAPAPGFSTPPGSAARDAAALMTVIFRLP